jgi:DNA modification methylase
VSGVGSARMVQGDCQTMALLRDHEVDLILTGPPYFSEELEALLSQPLAKQVDHEGVRNALLAYANSFLPQYEEMRRVLAPRGALILQLKDLVYGGVVTRITDHHASLVEGLGVRLTNRSWWRCQFQHPKRRSKVGGQVFKEPEQFLVFREPNVDAATCHGDADRVHTDYTSSPFWISPGEGGRRRMRHQAPQSVVRALIEMYSDEGDLFVDAFGGSGESLLTASRMGRRALGYEIDPELVESFEQVVTRRLLQL